MAYTEIKWVNINTGFDTTGDGSEAKPYKTIEYCKGKLTTTNPLVYISDGLYTISAISNLSVSGKTITYIGKSIKTIIECSNSSSTFLGAVTFNNCVFRPTNTFGGDTRFLHYASDSVSVTFNNCLFTRSLNGSYPTTQYFQFTASGYLFTNKIFNNCTFKLTSVTYVAYSYGQFNNCATENSKYNINVSGTYENTSVSNSVLDSNYKLTNGNNSLYGVYSGMNAWVDSFFLIKKDNNYYSLKSEYYDEVNHNFIPLALSGGGVPNKSDVEAFGVTNLKLLVNSMTKGSDTFRPIDKLKNCEVKCYSKI